MEEKKTIKVSLGTVICIFIIIILIMVLIGMWYYNNMDKVDNKQISQKISTSGDKQEKIVSEDKAEELNINGETVKNLYAKILKVESNYGPNDDLPKTYSFYRASKVTSDNLENDEKSFVVVNYLLGSNYGKKELMDNISSDIKNKFSYYVSGVTDDPKSGETPYCVVYNNKDIEYVKDIIFGSNVNINYTTFSGLACVVEFIDGNYYSYTFPGGGRGAEDRLFTKIEKATKDGDYIYIYDKCLYADLDPDTANTDNEKLALYTNTDKTKKIETIESDWQDYYNADNSYMNDYVSKLDTYKHTFKKDSNGNYYWISSEPANK